MRRLLAAFVALCLLAGAAPAAAQVFEAPVQGDPDAPLMLEADNLYYNTKSGGVTAVGNVYIAYRGYQVFANEVAYDQKNNVLIARHGVRLEEPEGNVVVADEFELSDDLRDGFLTGLRADTIYRTRLAANSATRAGELTIFQDAAYTACYTCRRRPDQPPTWAIKSRRVIYNEADKSLRFEDPRFDLFGSTVAVLPSFSIPDPTVRRRSGLLVPTFVASSLLGVGARLPYFQTLGPSADVTVAATPLSRQGLFGDIEYRQRTASGQFDLRAAGIWQADPGAFQDTSGDRRFRGSFTGVGDFNINPMWSYGFETTLTTDRLFLSDYKQDERGQNLTAPSSIYLKGLGERNNFEARLWAFRILQDDYRSSEILNAPKPFSRVGESLQGKQAYAAPAIDYEGVYDGAVLSGELAYKFNITSVSRQETDAFGALDDGIREARFRGVEGTFTRASAEVSWRKRLFAPFGQLLVPQAAFQGDLYSVDNRDPNVPLNDTDLSGRAMPTVGIAYRWPWLITAPWGTQTIEPIAEIFARPNETHIGDIPNEDAQSVVFDDTDLFGPTRFSGFDRVEGGVRANVGARYTLQTWSGASLSVVAGQSFHLAGRNSYSTADLLDTGANSGLSTDESDYVAGATLDTGALSFGAKGRFNDSSLDLQRAELSATARLGPVSTQVVYAFLAAQPDLGLVNDSSEIHGAASVRVFDRVRAFGQVRYDLNNDDIIRLGGGLAYDDDALSMSLSYSEDRGGLPDQPIDHTVFFRVGLRTVGDATASTGLDN